jgi:uncharacterized protein
MLTFAWDERKAVANLNKHGVSFDEARTVFSDEHARLIADPDNSNDEDRFIILGLSERTRMLVVCHCYRESDSIIRIITARKATRQEASNYGSFKK